MNDNVINLLQLYPRDMNIYGDWGNTLVLKRRLEWHGYQVNLLEYNPGDTFPGDVDLIVGGGGQDRGPGNAAGVMGVEMDGQADLFLQRLDQRACR